MLDKIARRNTDNEMAEKVSVNFSGVVREKRVQLARDQLF